MAKEKSDVRVRRVRATDCGRVAELCTQLGYPVSREQMKARLREVLKDREAACFVSESKQEEVIGWLHVSVTPLLENERRAEVNGLVVEENARSRGAGAALLAAGENWAREKRCKGMSVRSNILRERAHGFYLKHGYEHYKSQKAFRKSL